MNGGTGGGLIPRRGAVGLLRGVLDHGRMLPELVADADGPLRDLAPDQAARAQRMATGTLRFVVQINALLAPRLRKPPPAEVMHILRLAAWEILVADVPAYAAGDSAVRQVRGLRRHQHLSGLVNAVVRGLGRDGAETWGRRRPCQLPKWLDTPVRRAYGDAAALSIAAAHQSVPPVDLTPRDDQAAPALAERLGAQLLPTGSLRLAVPGQITTLPGYDKGEWWVQDVAAAIPVRALGPISGLDAVDLCAAPGGKTMQLAAGGADVTAIDVSGERLRRLRANLNRTALSARVLTADALDWAPAASVDLVVLDAPCSASGTLRRHPDLPFVRKNPDIAPLIALQGQLLDRAWSWLKPGGRLLYCTCSLLPAEGEDQAAAAMSRHLDMVQDPVRLDGLDPAWISARGALRLRPDYWPDRGGMDGFFATILRKSPVEP